jgi:hypothetical protein
MPSEYNSALLPTYVPTSEAGVVPETEQAYDIRAARISGERREAAFASANAILCDGQTKVEFFVSELVIGLGLAGDTSQGRLTQDFYAHNIILPSFTVHAQCLDQGDYSVLVEFVHQAQVRAVKNAANNVTQLEIKGGGFKVVNPIMKGPHKRTCVQGFIPRIERRYKAGVYAPLFEFPFTVARSFEGLYEDVEASVYENAQASWISILQGLTTPFVPVFQEETAKNSKPTGTPPAQASEPEEPNELIPPLPGGGPFG